MRYGASASGRTFSPSARCGTRHVRHALRRDSILREAEASLRRLGADAIDLDQIHWPVPGQRIEEGRAAMAGLKERGLVRHIGVSSFSASQPRRIASIAPAETIQPPYSLIGRGAEAEILPLAQRDGIGVIACSPMGSGLLTGGITRERIAAMPAGDWRKTGPRFTGPRLSRHLVLAARLQAADPARRPARPRPRRRCGTRPRAARSPALARPGRTRPGRGGLKLTGQDITEIQAAN